MSRFVKGLIIPILIGVSEVASSGIPLKKVVDVSKEWEIVTTRKYILEVRLFLRRHMANETLRSLIYAFHIIHCIINILK